MRFRLLHGRHVDEKGRLYTPGAIITTNMDLVASFGRSKFRRLTAGKAAEDDEDEEDEVVRLEGLNDDEDEEEEFQEEVIPDATDVTATFKAPEGVKIFQHPGNYYVVEKHGTATHKGKVKRAKVLGILRTLK